jgi:hypothetical protein
VIETTIRRTNQALTNWNYYAPLFGMSMEKYCIRFSLAPGRKSIPCGTHDAYLHFKNNILR